MLTLRSSTQTKAKRITHSSSQPTTQATVDLSSSHQLEANEESVVSRLKAILAEKAPEGLPLLDQLIKIMKPDPRELVETEKRSRSIVLSGVLEAEPGTPAMERQEHTERAVMDVLSVLEIETLPAEIYRMGRLAEGMPRLIKCVFPSSRAYFETLKKARSLRNIPGYDHIFIRKSMTQERERDRELRRQAKELNQKEHNGNRVYCVYRNKVVKVAEIVNIRAKNK